MPRPADIVPIFRYVIASYSECHQWYPTPHAPPEALFENAPFFVLRDSAPGLVPLYTHLSADGPWHKIDTSPEVPPGFIDSQLLGYALQANAPPTPGYVPLVEYTWRQDGATKLYTTAPSLDSIGGYDAGPTIANVWQGIDLSIRKVVQPNSVGGGILVLQGQTILAEVFWGTDGAHVIDADTPMLLGVASWGITAAAVLHACHDFPDDIKLDSLWWPIVNDATRFPVLPTDPRVATLTIRQLLQCVGTPIDNGSMWGDLASDQKWAYLSKVLQPTVLPCFPWALPNTHAPSAFCFAALAAAVEKVVMKNRGSEWDYRSYAQSVVGYAFVPGKPNTLKGFGPGNSAGTYWPPNGMPLYASDFGWTGTLDACRWLMPDLRENPIMAPLFQGDGTPSNPGLGWFTTPTDPYPSVGCNHDLVQGAPGRPGFVAVMYHFPDMDVVLLTNTNYQSTGDTGTVNQLVKAAYESPS